MEASTARPECAKVIELITGLCDRVRAHPLLRMVRCDLTAPREVSEIARLEQLAGRTLPAAYRELYSRLDGCHIEWAIDRDADPQAADALLAELRERGLAFEGQAEPLARIALVSVEDLLIGRAYLDFDADLESPIDFAGRSYREGDFLQTLRPLDAIDDAMIAVAMTDDPEWRLLLLTGNWAELDGSRRIGLEDYLEITARLWGLRMARQRVLGKYRGDRDPPVTAADIDHSVLLPEALARPPK